MKLRIASNSIDKINGIKIAFSRHFQIEETEIEVFHQSADSGVPDQPFGEETYQGAINRVKYLIDSGDTDFYISCEAGIEQFLDSYFNVQVVCIFDKRSQKYIFGKSAGWQVPFEDIDLIKEINLDNYLKAKGIMSIEQLLGPDYARAKAVTQATEFALASLKLC